MKRITIAACILLWAASAPAQNDDLFNQGETYYNRGNYKMAAKAFTQAVEADPEDAEAYFFMGNTYRRQGSYKQAVNAYRNAIKAAPSFARAYNNMGDAYDDQAMYAQAIAAYRKAISLKPDFVEAYCNMGSVYEEQGDYSQAISLFEKALSIDPNYAYAKYGLFAVRLRSSASQATAPVRAEQPEESRPAPRAEITPENRRPENRIPETLPQNRAENNIPPKGTNNVPSMQEEINDDVVVIVQPRPVERRIPRASAPTVREQRRSQATPKSETEPTARLYPVEKTAPKSAVQPEEDSLATTPSSSNSATAITPTGPTVATADRYTMEPNLPKPLYTGIERGRVVVDITIDSKGTVVEAAIGEGTDIVDEKVRNSALESARQTKFNPARKKSQKGRITYNIGVVS
jgi:TonB family protein